MKIFLFSWFWILYKKITSLWDPSIIAKTKSLLQIEVTECGSISLSIILNYYGHELLPEEARVACGVSRDGSKASHILKAARRYNMTAKGYNVLNLDGLNECPKPCILHWNFDHFVVFEGKSGNYYYINDPASGRRRVSFKEFNESFTGVVLVLTPNDNFQKRKLQSQLSIFFNYALKGGVLAIVAASALGVLQILPGVVLAITSKVFIDYIFIQSIHHWLMPLIGAVVLAAFFQGIFLLLQQRLLVRLRMHFTLNLSMQLLSRLFYLPLSFFDQRYHGDTLYRFSSVQRLSDLLSLEIMGAFINSVSIVLFSVVLYLLSPFLLFLVIGFILLRLFALSFFKRDLEESNLSVTQEASTLNGIEMNALSSMEMLKSNHFEGIFFKNWASHHDDLQNRTQKNALVNQNFNLIITFLTGLMSLCLLYSGVHLVLSGVMTIGTLMAFTSLVHYVDDPLVTLLSFFGNLEKIKADIYRLHDILFYGSSIKKTENSIQDAHHVIEKLVDNQPLIGTTKTQIQQVIEEGIVFHDVSFGYAPLDPPLLLKTNLVIQKGKTTALVGMSGSGKSTISKILCGLYSPSSGMILWNGQPLTNEEIGKPNQKLSLVDQDIFLFEGRVRDNLTLWRDDIPEEILLKAIQDVGLFNDLLPRGLLDAYVEENGMNFSGGQRQRLEIARALVSQPDLLILDEATSALDTLSEEAILNALKESKRTILVIAHRLSTIKNADIIYVLDQGRVVQCGDHEKLIQMPGLYQQLVTIEEAS